MLENHFDEAIRAVDEGIAVQPNRGFGYLVRGDIRWEQGRAGSGR